MPDDTPLQESLRRVEEGEKEAERLIKTVTEKAREKDAKESPPESMHAPREAGQGTGDRRGQEGTGSAQTE
jgi:hypothetical protein